MKSHQRKNCGMKCRQAIKEKNIARMECLQQKTKCVNRDRNYGLTTKSYKSANKIIFFEEVKYLTSNSYHYL